MGAACPFATAALYAAWDGYLGGGGRTLGAFLLRPSARTGDTAPNVEASGVRHLQHIAFQGLFSADSTRSCNTNKARSTVIKKRR
jgi:hypothetical protein